MGTSFYKIVSRVFLHDKDIMKKIIIRKESKPPKKRRNGWKKVMLSGDNRSHDICTQSRLSLIH